MQNVEYGAHIDKDIMSSSLFITIGVNLPFYGEGEEKGVESVLLSF